jgi:hypothetical protein
MSVTASLSVFLEMTPHTFRGAQPSLLIQGMISKDSRPALELPD